MTSTVVEPPNAVLFLVGREDYDPPRSFGDRTTVATHDCVATAVVAGAPTTFTFSATPPGRRLHDLGRHVIETEGMLSVRDGYTREYANVGVEPGHVAVTTWGDDLSTPAELVFQIEPAD
ncbi:MAG TPA: hypothetical protein VNS46_15985 [Nocardioides sp.]|nr:hypothetical protein [Nocardioides sp.]